MNRTLPTASLLILLTSLPACSNSGQSISPELVSGSEFRSAPSDAYRSLSEHFLAAFRLDVEQANLSATVTPLDLRRPAVDDPRQTDTYDIDLGALSGQLGLSEPSLFEIDSVAFDLVTLQLSVGFGHSHPFTTPPELSLPGSGTNRADLGYSGRAIVLLPAGKDNEVPNRFKFFSGNVVANVDGLVDPDGYLQLSTSDPLIGEWQSGSFAPFVAGVDDANTFPFKLIVDEALMAGTGNRSSTASLDMGEPISNGGNGLGNYSDAEPPNPGEIRGWQQNSIARQSPAGQVNNGWTGFDYLHVGQRAQQTLVFQMTEGEPLSVVVAFLIKFVDPRREPGPGSFAKYNLPAEITTWPEGTDTVPTTPVTRDLATIFAYRMPFGALDLSKITPDIDDGAHFSTATDESLAVKFKIRDWDKAATEQATDPPLFMVVENGRDDTILKHDVRLIPNGTSGLPKLPDATDGVQFSFGGVPSMSLPPSHPPLVTFDAKSGVPGDEFSVSGTVSRPFGSSLFGTNLHGVMTALIRAEDPEGTAPEIDAWYRHFGVIPNTPLGTDNPTAALQQELVTFQAIRIPIDCAWLDEPPVSTTPAVCGRDLTFALNVNGAELPDNYTWTFDPESVMPATSTDVSPTVKAIKGGTFTGMVRAEDTSPVACEIVPGSVIEFQYTIEPTPQWNESLALFTGDRTGRHNSVGLVPSIVPGVGGSAVVVYFDGGPGTADRNLLISRETTPGSGDFLAAEVIDKGGVTPGTSGDGTAGRFTDLLLTESGMIASYIREAPSGSPDDAQIRIAARNYANWSVNWEDSYQFALVDSGNILPAEFTSTGLSNFGTPGADRIAVVYALATDETALLYDVKLAWQNTATFPAVPANWTKETIAWFPRDVGPAHASIATYEVASARHIGAALFNPLLVGPGAKGWLFATTSAIPIATTTPSGALNLGGGLHEVVPDFGSMLRLGHFARIGVAQDPFGLPGSQDRLAIASWTIEEIGTLAFVRPRVHLAMASQPASDADWMQATPEYLPFSVLASQIMDVSLGARPLDLEVVDGHLVAASWFPDSSPIPPHLGRLQVLRACQPFPLDPVADWCDPVVWEDPNRVLVRHASIASNPASSKILLSYESEPGAMGNPSNSSLRVLETPAW